MGAVGLGALKQAHVAHRVDFEPLEAMGQHGVVALHLLGRAPTLQQPRGLVEGGVHHVAEGRQGLDLGDAGRVGEVSSQMGRTHPLRWPSREADDLPAFEGLKVAHRRLPHHAAGAGDEDAARRRRAHGAFALRVAR